MLNLSSRPVPRAGDEGEPSLVPAPAMVPILAQTAQPWDQPKRRGWRVLVAVAVALVVLVVGLAIALATLTNLDGATGRPATGTSTVDTTGETPSGRPPTPVPSVPGGFVDCSKRLSKGAYCATKNECWGGLFSYEDQPWLATPATCASNHVYQTFAAGPLTYEVRAQSRLNADPLVKKVCTADVANAMLPERNRRANWEVFAIGPQKDDASDYFRCVFGRGERSTPLPLDLPG